MERNGQLAQQIKTARQARDWTLDQFAQISGVSRAMFSKIERGEVSPTEATLARLAAGLGVTVSSLFSTGVTGGSPLSRTEVQSVWTDLETRYQRRNISPAGAQGAAEIVDVVFPPGKTVIFDNTLGWQGIAQQIWILDGQMEMSAGDKRTMLSKGDCLFMRLDKPLIFHSPTNDPARYAVILSHLFP